MSVRRRARAHRSSSAPAVPPAVPAPSRRAVIAAAAAVALAGALLAWAVDRTSPPASAETARGTEEAFSLGPHRRQVPGGGLPVRWTGPRDAFAFHRLPPGPAVVDVALAGHRSPVQVAASGVVLGAVLPGQAGGRFALPAGHGPAVRLDLATDVAPGAPPGAMVQRVRVETATPALPAAGTLALFLVPALVLLGGALLAGTPAPWATLLAVGNAALLALALWPAGLVRSGHASTLAAVLTLGAAGAGLFGRALARRSPGAGPLAVAACLATLWVQILVATSPVMVVSDVVFHANKLRQVAGGDLFPVSVTQHAVPFRIPYGVSFYALLAPLLRLGLDPVALVRGGAALAGALSTLLLLPLLLGEGPRRAALACLLVSTLPVTIDVFSYGNLSNVFGQALTVAFFAWWAGGARGGAPVGAALLATAGLAHLSSLVVLVVLAPALLLLGDPAHRADRARRLALALGCALTLLYYAHFWRDVAAQLPRLAEGGGSGKAPRGLGALLVDQLLWARLRWGLPAILLAAAGLWRRPETAVARDLLAFWAAGGLLFLAALVSPVEVRYLYALGVPLAVAAAAGASRLVRLGLGGHLAAAPLLAWQGVVGVRAVLEALLERYR